MRILLALLFLFKIWATDSIDNLSTQIQNSGQIEKQYSFIIENTQREEAILYKKLQKLIASKIPHEYDRPVIEIRAYLGKKVENPKIVGILGGMGPLSDASLFEKVVSKIPTTKKDIMIHLLSLPPPRSLWEKISGGMRYINRLRDFLNTGYSHYFLASNAAHTNFKSIKRLAPKAHIVHLPRLIVEKLNSNSPQSKTLILGTNQTWSSQLYDKLLMEKELPFASVTEEEQFEIQGWIDIIKRGKTIPHLEVLIRDLAIRYHATNILLGCTELPLGLDENITQLSGFNIIDSEEIFADFISQTLQ